MQRRFLYFIPGMQGTNPAMLAKLGLIDRFCDHGRALIEHGITGIDEGPAGAGCIVAAGGQPPMFTPEQKWTECKNFWLTIEDMPPRPEELARPVGISGYEVDLGDGNKWRVPVIHLWNPKEEKHVPNVPCKLATTLVNGRYQYGSKVRPEFAVVDKLATRLFEDFCAERTIPMDIAVADAATLLAVNYRIGVEEIGLLGLLDELSVVGVLGFAFDTPGLRSMAEVQSARGLQWTDPTPSQE